MATTGSLSYDFSNKNFLVNRTGTDDGWVSLPISPSAENITQEDLKTWANKLGGQNQSRLYVDIGNPLASDSKNNRGNSQLRPFRSIERALAEVARISFKKNPAGNSTPNDAFERITISIAPGEYEVQNGPRSKLGVFDNYGRYQDAAFLIGERKDTIVDTSFAAITDPSYRISTYEQDLDYFLNAIIKDLSTGGNVYTLRVAQTLVTSDESVGYNGPNDPQSGYFVTRYADGAARTQLVTALNTLAIEAKAAMRDATGYDIILDNASPTCQDVADSIDTLTNIIINTFNCGIDPRDATLIKYGAYSASEFPVSEPSKADLQRFNSINNAGIILPRGVSIVGEDLRKVVIRPTYVPDPTDPLVGRGAIFRMTGGNFFSGFTIKDQKLKNTANPSHHKLTAFEFCSEEDLESYYTDIDIAFSDPNVYNRALDAANLLEKNEKWIAENFDFPNNDYGLVFESESEQLIIAIQKDLRGITNKNVIEFGKKFHNAHIAPLEVSTQAPARDAYHNLLDDLYSDIVRAISNLGGVVDLEVIDSGTESEVFDGVRAEPFVGRCADIQAVLYTYIEAVKALITDPTASIAEGLSRQAFAFEPSDIEVRDPENSIVLGLSAAEEVNTPGADKINTVLGASPYIFSASIRSEYGLCGIDGDGSKVTGLKSYLAAQFTIVSLQKDPAAFVEDTVEVGGNRYRGSKIADSVDYTHFGYRVSNRAYSQLVSCFCIGPARHYVAESGGEFSITNSTSNFGDVSLYSRGYNDYLGTDSGAFKQDKDHALLGLIKPKSIKLDDASESAGFSNIFLVGDIVSFEYNSSWNSDQEINFDAGWTPPSSTWKTWINDFNTPIRDPETGETIGYDRTSFLPYSTFTSLKYAKITLPGRFRDLGPSVGLLTENDSDIGAQGLPDLKYVYAPVPQYSSEILDAVIALDGGPVSGYNTNLSTPKRARVAKIREVQSGDTWESQIIIDISSGPSVVGEWFERSSVFNVSDLTSPSKATLTSEIIGNSLSVRRFVDTRSAEDRLYKFIFKRASTEKRIPPDNYILRKGNIASLDLQPFKEIDPSNLDSIFYVSKPRKLLTSYIEKLDSNTTLEVDPTFDDLFYVELISANSNSEYQPQSLDDLVESSRIYIKEDAQVVAANETLQKSIANPSNYLSLINTLKVISLGFNQSFADSIEESIKVDSKGSESRIYLFSSPPNNVFEFNKPSIIRAAGQTWEFCGYYNYSTGLPSFQAETIGDRVPDGERALFRIGKIQKSISGGRIYATGMDELGNLIQGDTILDLKSGQSETIIRGTSPEVIAINTEIVTNPEFTPPQKLTSLEVTDTLTVGTKLDASAGSEIDLSKASSFLLPGATGENSSSSLGGTQANPTGNLSLYSKKLDLSTVDTIITKSFSQKVENDSIILDLTPEEVSAPVKLETSRIIGTNSSSDPTILENNWTLSSKATDAEVTSETINNKYITPSQLRTWRTSKGILTTTVSNFNVYVGLGWINPSQDFYPPEAVGKPSGDGPVVGATVLAQLNAWDLARGGEGYQCTNKDGINFRPLSNLDELQLYCQNLTSAETVTVYLKPGVFLLRNIGGFKCGIKFVGELLPGRFDGRDHIDMKDLAPGETYRQSISPTIYSNVSRDPVTNKPLWDSTKRCYINNYGDYVSGLRSSIIVRSDIGGFDTVTDTISDFSSTSGPRPYAILGIQVLGNSLTFERIVFWGYLTWYKMATERLWVDYLMDPNRQTKELDEDPLSWNTSNIPYDYSVDIDQLFAVTGSVPNVDYDLNNRFCAAYRSEMLYTKGSGEMRNFANSWNNLGYNHPAMLFNSIPLKNNKTINTLIHAHEIRDAATTILLGRGNSTSSNAIYYYWPYGGTGSENPYSPECFLLRPQNTTAPADFSVKDSIIGPSFHSQPWFGLYSSQKLSLYLENVHIRGNIKDICSDSFDTKGLVGGKLVKDGGYTISISSIHGIQADTNGEYSTFSHSPNIISIRDGVNITSFNLKNPNAYRPRYADATYRSAMKPESNGVIFERTSDGNMSYDIELITDKENENLRGIPWSYTGVDIVHEGSTWDWADLKLRNFRTTVETGPDSLKYPNREGWTTGGGTFLDPNVQLGSGNYPGEYGEIVCSHLFGKNDTENELEYGPILNYGKFINLFNGGQIQFTSYNLYSPFAPGGYNKLVTNQGGNLRGLFVEVMSNASDSILTNTTRIKKGHLYKIISLGSNPTALTAVGASITPAVNELFIADSDGISLNGDPAVDGSVELIAGSPKVYKPYEYFDKDSSWVGDEIGQFLPVSYYDYHGFSGSLGNSCYILGFSANPASALVFNGVTDGYISSLYATPSYPINVDTGLITSALGNISSNIQSYDVGRRFFTTRNWETIINYGIEGLYGSFLNKYYSGISDRGVLVSSSVLLFAYLYSRIKLNIYSGGQWGQSTYGDNFGGSTRSGHKTGSYLPTQLANLIDQFTEDTAHPLGLVLNPSNYLFSNEDLETYVANMSSYDYGLNNYTKFNNFTLNESINTGNWYWI